MQNTTTMQAAVAVEYGSPNVLSVQEVSAPSVGAGEILVRVHASPVTQGDRRLRSSDFPGFTWLPGRLMMGLLRPRNATGGTMFAGEVIAIGEAVTRFAVGDRVFGQVGHGAWAEYLTMSETDPVAQMPTGLSYAEAAALPYGAGTARHFLNDFAGLRAGERVLIVGATGEVGRSAVQLARHMGAEVTAVGRRGLELARELGASHVIDATREDFTANGERYDVIFDTSGTLGFDDVRGSLSDTGRFMSLYMSIKLLLQMALTSMTEGPRAITGVSMGTQESFLELRALIEEGAVRPILDRHYPLERIVEAHARVEGREGLGSVMVTVGSPVAEVVAEAA